MRKFSGLTALALLGACSNVDWAALESQMQFANLEAEAARTLMSPIAICLLTVAWFTSLPTNMAIYTPTA